MKFTTFGAWDKEVRTFIEQVSKDAQVDKEKLTAWFYSDAMMTFQKTQQADFVKFMENCAWYGIMKPVVGLSQMFGMKLLGFQAMFPDFMKLVPDDKKAIATEEWRNFVYLATENHKAFCKIQADITTTLKQDPWMPTRMQAFEAMIGMFTDAATKNPNLAEEINNEIILQVEFMEQVDPEIKATPAEPLAQAQAASSSTSGMLTRLRAKTPPSPTHSPAAVDHVGALSLGEDEDMQQLDLDTRVFLPLKKGFSISPAVFKPLSPKAATGSVDSLDNQLQNVSLSSSSPTRR